MNEVDKLNKLTNDQKKGLKDDIVKASEGSFSAIIDAKMNFDADVEDIKSTFGLAKGTVKRLIKEHYEQALEEEKKQIEEFERLYKEVMGV